MTSLSLGPRLTQEAKIYSEVGPFNGNVSELVRRAVDEFLRRQAPELRMGAALRAYQETGVTVTRAAEIAGVSFDAMWERLKREGALREGIPAGLVSPSELSKRRKALASMMKTNRKKPA